MSASEGYFFLESLKTFTYLDNDGEDKAGSKLVLKAKAGEHEWDKQLWTFENGYLVSKKSSLVMDIDGGDLKTGKKVLQYDRKKTMAHNQKWGFRDGFVYAVADPTLVLSIKENDDNQVTVTRRTQEDNDYQQWNKVTYIEDY